MLSVRNGRLYAGNYVGVIESRGGTLLEILPKVDFVDDDDQQSTRKVFLTMLRTYRGLRAAQFNETGISELRYFNMLDIFVRLFLTNLVLLVQRGLARQYRGVEETLPWLRGRIQFPEHIRRNAVNRALFHVAFDEFTADRPENRLNPQRHPQAAIGHSPRQPPATPSAWHLLFRGATVSSTGGGLGASSD